MSLAPQQGNRDEAGPGSSVSVAICTRDRVEELGRCLRALRRLEFQQFELVVANNGSREENIKELCSEFGAKYIRVEEPGLSFARNSAALACTGQIVAFIDDDAVAEPGWLPNLLNDFEDPSVMVITGRVNPLLANTDTSPISSRSVSSPDEPSERIVLDKNSEDWFARANFGGLGIGCNMAFRRSAWDIWPGFDARLGRGAPIAGWEEHFAFFELIEKGYRVVHAPLSAVRHGEPKTMIEVRRAYLRALGAVSAYMTMLFAEFPRHRRALWNFCIAGLKRTPRRWRPRRQMAQRLAPRWLSVLRLMSGPFVYGWVRVKKGRRPAS